MENLTEIACDYFLNKGYSCSESVVMAAADIGYVPYELVNCATGFSGGFGGSKCVCGTISGAVLVLSYNYGKNKTNIARELSKKFYQEFIKIHGASCCKVLTAKFKDDFHSKERKNHCVNMLQTSTKILNEILAEQKANEEKTVKI